VIQRTAVHNLDSPYLRQWTADHLRQGSPANSFIHQVADAMDAELAAREARTRLRVVASARWRLPSPAPRPPCPACACWTATRRRPSRNPQDAPAETAAVNPEAGRVPLAPSGEIRRPPTDLRATAQPDAQSVSPLTDLSGAKAAQRCRFHCPRLSQKSTLGHRCPRGLFPQDGTAATADNAPLSATARTPCPRDRYSGPPHGRNSALVA